MRDLRRFTVLVILALASLFFLAGCGPNLTAADYVVKAQEHMDKGEWRSAFIQLSNALQQDPNSLDARWLLAQVSLKEGDAAKAEKEARWALELGHPPAEAQPLLVRSLLLQSDLDGVLVETVSMPPDASPADRAKLLGLRGQAYILKRQFDQANLAFELALEQDPQATDALVGLAILHATQGETEEARQMVARALEADAASPEAWSVLGDLEWNEGQAAEAETAFGNAIQHREYPTLDRAKRALARLQLEKFPEAEADLRVLKNQGWRDHPYVNYLAGLVHFRQNQYAQAADAFEASFNADATFLPNRFYLATTRLLLGQTQQALQHAQAVYASAPRSAAAGRLLGSINLNLADYAAAKNTLQATLQNSPEDRTSLHMLTAIALLEGDAAQGVAYASRLAALEPDSSQVGEMLMVAKLMAGQPLEEPGVSSPPAIEDGDDYSREFLRALEAFRNNQFGQALEQAKKLHALHPDRVDPLNLMAACYLATGQWDLAKVELEKVLALKANEPSAARSLAKVEAQQGNLDRSRTLLKSLLAEHSGDQEAALLLAEVETRLGNPEAGLAVLRQALEARPDLLVVRAKLAQEHFRAGRWAEVLQLTRELTNQQFQAQPALLEFQGKSQMQTGDLPAARESFRRWAEAAPDSAEAHFLYGDTLARGGDERRAAEALQRALQADRTYLPARVGEIKLLVRQNQLEQAKTALGALRTEFGERPEVLGIEGWFALGTRDYATAAASFSAAHAQRPDTELTVLLVRALWGQEQHDAAIATMNDWLADHPADMAVLLHLAGAYLGLERTDDAVAAYSRVLEHYPEHVPSINNIAWLTRKQDPEGALKHAQRAYRLAPEDPHVLDTLGMLLLEGGDLAGAHRFVGQAAERAPNDPQIRLHLASILARQAQWTEARAAIEAVLALSPGADLEREARTLLETIDTTVDRAPDPATE